MSFRRSKSALSVSLLAISVAAATPFALELQDEETPPDPEMLGDLNSEGGEEDSEEVNHGSYPEDFVAAGSSLYMSADSGKGQGDQLYAYLPSDEACELVTGERLGASVVFADPTRVVVVGDWGFFTAQTTTKGKHELWRVHRREASPIQLSSNQFISDVDRYAEMGSYLLFFQKSRGKWKVKTVHADTGVVRDLEFSIDQRPEILGSGSDFVAFTIKRAGDQIMYVCNQEAVKEIPIGKLNKFRGSFVRYRETLVFSGEDVHGDEPWIFVYK